MLRKTYLGRVLLITIASLAIMSTSCGGHREAARAVYRSVAEIERSYGPLIGAGNHPTADQHGTGERVGLFADAAGAIWGLPLAVGANGEVVACAPPGLQSAKVPMALRPVPSWSVPPTRLRAGAAVLEIWSSSCEVHMAAWHAGVRTRLGLRNTFTTTSWRRVQPQAGSGPAIR